MSEIDLKKVANLARLELNETLEKKLAKKSHDLMGLIDQMQAVDTDGIEAMAHPLAIQQPTRPDEALPCDRDHLQQSAPKHATSHHLYLVPQVID